MKKALPVGADNFEQIIKENYYYVDKTLFIKELIDKKAEVNLFTRPRRFGKTLALSMLKYYFEDTRDFEGNKIDNSELFKEHLISNQEEKYANHLGKYPVIFMSLKTGKQKNFNDSYQAIVSEIKSEFERHSYILEGNELSTGEKNRFKDIKDNNPSTSEYKSSLKFLSQCLEKWHGEKAIVLIDEYDVPLEGAYINNFYDEMMDFIRGVLDSLLKTNDSLYFAVLTGCLRITNESIFTGLNNFDVNSILSYEYGEFFGFTEEEVKKMCSDYELEDKFDEMKTWYNGYLFGDTNVYNPWSCIKYIKDHLARRDCPPISYWVNTSSNSIIRELINRSDNSAKAIIERLIAGGNVTVQVHEDITYDEVYNLKAPIENMWNLMFFSGYLKKVGEKFEHNRVYVTLSIANTELQYIFEEKVEQWFREKIIDSNRDALFNALFTGDAPLLSKELTRFLGKSISYMDTMENFYHGFMVGILAGLPDYQVLSNRESGDGRSDIILKPVNIFEPAYILELKASKEKKDFFNDAKKAIQQIKDKKYEQELINEGYDEIRRYGISFFMKNCYVEIG